MERKKKWCLKSNSNISKSEFCCHSFSSYNPPVPLSEQRTAHPHRPAFMSSLSKTILSHSQYFQTPPTTSSSTPPSENDADQDQCSMWVESLRLVRYLLLAICLQPVVDRGKLNCCDHLFCFECILQWSKVFYSSLVDLFSNLLNFRYRMTTLGRKHLSVVQTKVQ